MRKLVAALALAALGTVSTPTHAGDSDWNNIMYLNIGYGTTYTMNNPHLVPRPYRGDLLRVTVPHSCGATQLHQMGLWGRSLNGQRIQLGALLVGNENDLLNQRYVFTYQVNGGAPATVFEVGIYATTWNWSGCEIAFEQANTQALPAACEEETICTMHIDNTQYCTAVSTVPGGPFYLEWAEDADNSCFISGRLEDQICEDGNDPEDFTIECF